MNPDTTPTPRFDALRKQTSTYPRCTAIDYFKDFSRQLERELDFRAEEARIGNIALDNLRGELDLTNQRWKETKSEVERLRDEVGRLRELLNRAIEIADEAITPLQRSEYSMDGDMLYRQLERLREEVAQLAPVPEEPVTGLCLICHEKQTTCSSGLCDECSTAEELVSEGTRTRRPLPNSPESEGIKKQEEKTTDELHAWMRLQEEINREVAGEIRYLRDEIKEGK